MAISKGSNIAGPGGAAAEQWIEEGHGQGVCLRTGTSSGDY